MAGVRRGLPCRRRRFHPPVLQRPPRDRRATAGVRLRGRQAGRRKQRGGGIEEDEEEEDGLGRKRRGRSGRGSGENGALRP